MADDRAEFLEQGRREIAAMGDDHALAAQSREWLVRATDHRYAHHFTWCGLPIIQLPQDIVAMQEIIWRTRPRLIIETGIARGGSLILYASMLQLLGEGGRVVGVDVDIRAHNRDAIEASPFADRITLLEGSSIEQATIDAVGQHAAAAANAGDAATLVVLDSNHTHDHVLAELRAYAPLVTAGCYLVVFDTLIEQLPAQLFGDRPWSPGNSPWSAVQAFLRETDRFEIDRAIPDKLQLTVAPDGYLRCTKA